MNIYTNGVCGNIFPQNKNGFWTNVAKLWSSYDNKTTELIQRAILLTGILLFFCYNTSAQKIDVDTVQRNITVDIRKQDSSFFSRIKDVIRCHNGYIDSEKEIDALTLAIWLESDDVKNEDIAFFRRHFISGYQFFCDVESTKKPMISIQKLIFNTEEATNRYADYLKNDAFPLRETQVIGDTAIIIKNTGNNVYYSNSRIFISNRILYFLHCWDSCSLIFFTDITNEINKIRVNVDTN